ncbi:hypothetical protein A2Y85_05715 [candidate division WOR-3 bacterium RBG_13_43_14]|uniref:DNA ligase n=1 Tax=candidate division WOR-3 bacterium RBG_13_43_14 TaxID=1802590 RepID=A0A1F4UGA4_UNCW3|nr:MAG: hypothetical protein A2Y85_05715 [candidate division WOR-3 bacterium RBG_13_43_14]
MDLKKAKKQAEKLRKEINLHDYRYYVLNEPTISDNEYDRVYKELVGLEKAFPELITADSPTRRIGGKPLSGFRSVTHSIKMLSLDNTYSEEEVRNFDERIQRMLGHEVSYEVTLKVDGVAVALVYKNGRLETGSTRGDGTTGDDVTQNIRTIRAVPLSLLTDDPEFMNIEVRAEVFLTRKNFDLINKQREEADEPLFVNPRNAAAGTLKLLDPKEVAKRNLDVFVHTVPTPLISKYNSHFQILKRLEKYGFRIIRHIRLCPTITEVMDEIEKWREKRSSLQFDVDGLVIKVDDPKLREQLGATIKSPRWAIAYKYPAVQLITKLLAIQLQVGRTGRITPVAVLAPVFLSGSTISRATLHNEDEIVRKDIRVGDDVIIEKGGEVIPKVVKVIKENRSGKEEPFRFPVTCPVCSEKIYRLPEEADWKCLNSSCPAQIKASILHFASRPAMDITGLGSSLVEQIVDKSLVESYDDLYDLNINSLVDLERMGPKSAQKIISSIEASKNKGFAIVLFALGIPGIGINASHLLTERFKDIDDIIDVKIEELSTIKGIGPVLAMNIKNYFNTSRNIKLINNLKKAGLMFKRTQITTKNTVFSGMTFIFTGELKTMTREQAQRKVRDKGGIVSNSISRNISLMVVGTFPGTKYAKAVSLGLKIINEKQFINILKED